MKIEKKKTEKWQQNVPNFENMAAISGFYEDLLVCETRHEHWETVPNIFFQLI